jgi:cytochrome c-type biogenesis protein CcmH
MTQFWIIAAGLIILAMAFLLPPLFRRGRGPDVNADELNLAVIKQQLAELKNDLDAGELDQAYYDAARRDLEKELLEDVSPDEETITEGNPKAGRWVIPLSALLIPVVAIPLYLQYGSPQVIEQMANAPVQQQRSRDDASHSASGPNNMGDMVQMIENLAKRLEQEPNNPEGWAMLGRSYMSLNRFDDALNAYAKAYKLMPNNPDLLLGYATTMARVNNNQFTGRPAELISEAMKIDPNNPNVLWLKGITHFQAGEAVQAIQVWERVQVMLEPGSEEALSVSDYIREAKAQLPAGSMAAAAPAQSQPTADNGKSIQVTVDLDPALRDKVQASDRVFIFARALTGPPMPLAAARRQVKDLPLTVVLDDSMAMMPQLTLSKFPEVVVGARVSKSGDPIPKSGDLQGEVSPVKPGQKETVTLVVNTIVP